LTKNFDRKITLEIIERMQLAKIGDYKKWEKLIKKINDHDELNEDDWDYFSSLTRIYKDSKISGRSKIYHTKLSKEDSKPPCKTCGEKSLFYCNMNDAYFCQTHVVGHDENE